MPHWLEHIAEPDRLLLAWQAPVEHDRYRWAVGEITRAGEDAVLRYFGPDEAEFVAANPGRRFAELAQLGYFGHPAFSARQRVHRAGVMEVFRRRLPPDKRADFEAYKSHFRLPGGARLSDFALLGVTEAKLPSDGFSLVDPLEGPAAPRDLLLEVAGYRHYARGLPRPVREGVSVQIVPEPANPHDPDAVMFRVDQRKVGNVNRLQARGVSAWLGRGLVEAWAERLNGTLEAPRLFVFISVRPKLPAAA